jgi:hypothetical protein
VLRKLGDVVNLGTWRCTPFASTTAALARPVALWATVLLAQAACAQEPVRVSNTPSSDYGRDQLNQAVATFVASGRSALAYAALSRRTYELLPTMDKTVADEAELKLTILALAPTKAVQARPMAEQVATLATTVWPTGFGEQLRPPSLLRGLVRSTGDLLPQPKETAAAYVLRVCAGPLSQVCRDAVPEHQGALLAAYAVHRFSERARSAISDCLVCSTEPLWRAAAREWEELDTANNAWIRDIERRSAPSNWAVAGSASEDDLPLPEVELSALGELLLSDQSVAPAQRPKALRELLGDGKEIALHARPDTSLAHLRALASELQRAGASTVALVTREPTYPWRRRLYHAALGKGRRVDSHPTDTLQVLLRLVDPLGPGMIRLD